VAATDSATRHKQTPQAALTEQQYRVQLEINAAETMNSHSLLPAMTIGLILVGLGVLTLIALGVTFVRWGKRNGQRATAEACAGVLFISPWAFGFIVFTLGPILASFVLSFCDYDVIHPARWAGMSNYVTLFTTDRALAIQSLYNVFYISVFGIPLGMITGLAMALMLNTKVRGLSWFRTIFYIPSVVPIVATVVLWNYILNSDPHRGLINAAWLGSITHWFGIAPPGWEAVPAWSKPGVILCGLWGAGGGMILWLIGLQSIPITLYEAASLDGAGWWSKFWNVTFPMLSPIIFFNVVIGIIGAVQTFDNVYIFGGTGNGGGVTGPDNSLLCPVVYLFNYAFQYFKMGYASAIAWLLFIIVLGLTVGQLKLAPKWVYYEGKKK
jgi:multiple sugar transport system permease protein